MIDPLMECRIEQLNKLKAAHPDLPVIPVVNEAITRDQEHGHSCEGYFGEPTIDAFVTGKDLEIYLQSDDFIYETLHGCLSGEELEELARSGWDAAIERYEHLQWEEAIILPIIEP